MPDNANLTVAHIKDHFLPRSETFIFTLLSALRRYSSIILNRHARQNAQIFPVKKHFSPVERFDPWAGLLERVALRLLGHSPYLEHVLRTEQVRLIHAHFGQLGALFVPVARRHGLPLVTSFHGTDVSVFAAYPAWQRHFEALWEYGHRFLVVGPAMAERLKAVGCPEDRIEVLPLPLDLRKFGFVERRPAPGEPICILTVGRLIPKKGINILLQALATLKSRYSLRLWIAGDGPQRPQLESLTAELELGELVEFWGWVEHTRIADLMAQAHLFVLASRTDPETGETEGSPTVLLEAQAMGLPVVSTFHGDIPFIVQDGQTGVLVPEGNAEALASALDELLRYPERWVDLGRAGRAFVESRHEMYRVGARLEEIYDQCLRGDESTSYPLP
ncbi:MAG: glycosyltransferase [Anaerolineae bacterium]